MPIFSRTGTKTRDMTYIALFAVFMAVCAWISIPAAVPFTMQTFGVFLSVGLLGGRRGTLSVLVYLLMGAVGIPVFTGFQGGLGALLNATGGYLLGFLLSVLLMWAMERSFGRSLWILGVSMVLGLAVCYAFGTAWYMFAYARTSGAIGLGATLLWCVVPYIIPDAVKIALALFLSRRFRPLLKL